MAKVDTLSNPLPHMDVQMSLARGAERLSAESFLGLGHLTFAHDVNVNQAEATHKKALTSRFTF